MLCVSGLLLQSCQMSPSSKEEPELFCFWPQLFRIVSDQGLCDTSLSFCPMLECSWGIWTCSWHSLRCWAQTPSLRFLCVSSTAWDNLWRKRGPEVTPSHQVNSHPKRLEMQTESRKPDGSRFSDSLVDLSEGRVFLSGREPWCRNRLKPGTSAAAIAEAVYLNLFAVWSSGLAAILPNYFQCFYILWGKRCSWYFMPGRKAK